MGDICNEDLRKPRCTRSRAWAPSHSGTGHFWHERVTAVALIPLSLWFLM